MKNNKYYEGKEKAREEAIEWQASFGEEDHYWSELFEAGYYFRKLAKRFGLIREFTVNGII